MVETSSHLFISPTRSALESRDRSTVPWVFFSNAANVVNMACV